MTLKRSTPEAGNAEDAIDRLIQLAQLEGRVDVYCRLGGGFHLHHGPEPDTARLHWVVEGAGWLCLENASPVRLRAGDAVLLPRDSAHSIADSRAALAQPPGQPQLLASDGVMTLKVCGGDRLHLLCGYYRCARHAALWLGMPDCLLLPLPELHPFATAMLDEAVRPRSGSRTVIDALSQVLLVGALRRYRQQQCGGDASFLSQLSDPRLGVLLSAVLAAPQADWCLERMAEKAGLSRAQLMRLFKPAVGLTPQQFVQSIRLQRAAVQLRRGSDTVLKVALDNGFASEAHFNRSFKHRFGVTPGQYRRGVAR